jgi:hypothetical protein
MSIELPNYFLADLADSSTLTPRLVTEACQALKRNRSKFLAEQTTENLIQIIEKLSREWLDADFPYRQLVMEKAPVQTGFSRETISAGLDRFFGEITAESLENLILQDLGSPRRLDEFVATEGERRQNRVSIARGPELLVHITGGILPNPTLTSMILGLLVRSAQFVKCATGTSFIPRIFAHSLYAAQPKLGACMEVAEWKGGTASLEEPLFAETTLVTATGGDETIAALRRALPAQVQLIGYGHKLSLAYVTRESLGKAEKLAAALARDVSAWNQLGCLSPHAIYVDAGGATASDQFAELLAGELEAIEKAEPRGPVSTEISAAISTRRMAYQVRASADPATKIWQSENSTAWTVVHDPAPEFQTSCLNRFVYVKPVEHFDQFLASLEPLRGKISTVGLAAPNDRIQELGLKFAEIGVTRICRAGQMQTPSISWRHDGRPSLGDLVTWTDIEF